MNHAREIRFSGQPVSLNLEDSDLKSVMRIFAEITKRNIVLHPAVSGKVHALNLHDVPVDQAFDTVLRLYDLYAVDDGRIIIVYPTTKFIQDSETRAKARAE